jgi:bifunctional DNA-binding transcriptional regulator/antitoxin component of YhaV-PrlF toxin-antitoxin module
MLVQTDTRRRITLPPNAGIKAGDALNLEVLEDGRIVLVPVEPVPRHQLWAWTAESKQAIVASLADPRPSEFVETPEQASAVADRWSHED